MFKFIGGVVMCGFALYGLVKYLERPVMKVVSQSDGRGNAETGAGKTEDVAPSTGHVATADTADAEPRPVTA